MSYLLYFIYNQINLIYLLHNINIIYLFIVIFISDVLTSSLCVILQMYTLAIPSDLDASRTVLLQFSILISTQATLTPS